MKLYVSQSNSSKMTMGKAPNEFEVHAITCGENERGSALGVLTCNAEIQIDDLVEIGETRTGKPRLIKREVGISSGYIVNASASGPYTRGTHGYIEVLRGNPIMLASGKCSWGAAGNMGSYEEAIYAMNYGDVLRVRRASPGKGCEPFFLIATPLSVLSLTETDLEHWLDNFDGEVEKVKGRGDNEYIIPIY